MTGITPTWLVRHVPPTGPGWAQIGASPSRFRQEMRRRSAEKTRGRAPDMPRETWPHFRALLRRQPGNRSVASATTSSAISAVTWQSVSLCLARVVTRRPQRGLPRPGRSRQAALNRRRGPWRCRTDPPPRVAALTVPAGTDRPVTGLSVSIGAAVSPIHGAGLPDLLRAADAALFVARACLLDLDLEVPVDLSGWTGPESMAAVLSGCRLVSSASARWGILYLRSTRFRTS
jgi:hypothetical protein